MGLFDFIFGKPKLTAANGYFKTLTAYSPTFTTWSGALYESELVRSAIDARARHISKLKFETIGAAKPKLQNKLKHAPNDFQTWSQFFYRLSTILDMQNTAFIVPVLNGYGELAGYFPVLPSKCEIVQDNFGRPWLRYKFTTGETAAVEFDRCGVMTRFQYADDFFGESNNALRDTMQLINMENQGIEEAVKNSATYRFMARVNNFSRAEDLTKERQRFSQENFGAESQSGGLLLFPNTYTDIRQITNTPYNVDAAQRDLIQKNVFNYFGVNEKILQNAAVGDEWNAFYEGCIEVFSIQFSEVMTRITFTETERAHGSKIMATANRLQYMSNTDKLNVSAQMADRGIMTINEIREIWNLPPVDGGDVATIRGEYYTMDGGNKEDED